RRNQHNASLPAEDRHSPAESLQTLENVLCPCFGVRQNAPREGVDIVRALLCTRSVEVTALVEGIALGHLECGGVEGIHRLRRFRRLREETASSAKSKQHVACSLRLRQLFNGDTASGFQYKSTLEDRASAVDALPASGDGCRLRNARTVEASHDNSLCGDSSFGGWR